MSESRQEALGYSLVALTALAAAGIGLYAALAARYPLAAGLLDPRSSWTRLVEGSAANLALHIGLYVLLTLAYVGGYRILAAAPGEAAGRRRFLLVVAAGWLASSAVLLTMAPGGESHDVFDYLFRGRMQAEFGGSPLAQAPEEFPDAAFLRYVSWRKLVDAYGPLWEYASHGVAALVRLRLQATGEWGSGLPSCPASPQSCRMLATYVTAYRLLAVGLAGLCGGLVYRIVRRSRPALAPAALLIWLWNPLLLIASAVGAHNDLLMLLFWFLTFWAFQHGRWAAGLLALVLAAHVKLTALLLAPLCGFWLARKLGWRPALVYGAAAAAAALPLSWLLYAPFGGWATLPRNLYERGLFVANSPHHLALRLLSDRPLWPGVTAAWLVTRGATLAFALLALLLSAALIGVRQRDERGGSAPAATDDERLWWAAVVLTLAYLLVGSFWFQHWYLLWVLAPAALLPGSRFTARVLPWLCFGALSGNLIGNFLARPPFTRTGVIALVVGVTWLPALLAAWIAADERFNANRAQTGR